MEVTLNGLSNPSNIITFTNCPTILTVSEEETVPSHANYRFSINPSGLTQGKDYYISINGYQIHSVWEQENEVGQKFYLTKDTSLASQRYIASSIVKALRNVGALAANYKIFQTLDDNGLASATVCVYSKDIGSKNNISFATNMPSSAYTTLPSGGYSTNSLLQGKNNYVGVEIYKAGIITKPGGASPNLTYSLSYYVTSLKKNYIGGDLSFDLSPIFSSLTDYNDMSEFYISVYTVSDNKVTNTVYIPKIYAVNGYLVNQGTSFIPAFTDVKLAQNVYKGESKSTENNTILYIYGDLLTFSLYSTNSVTSLKATVNYLDSALNTVYTAEHTLFLSTGLTRVDLPITQNDRFAYIDVTVDGLSPIRYNIIKPLTATAETQRIYWTNSYGGVSFFDFTGDRTEQRKTDVEYYQTQLFDYYKKSYMERNKVYNKDVSVSVTLKTHNIEKDGQWTLFDLQNSWNAWTVVNDKTYKITINDLKITESSVTGIYQGEITYEYSLGDSF